jgi:hypothetical protein
MRVLGTNPRTVGYIKEATQEEVVFLTKILKALLQNLIIKLRHNLTEMTRRKSCTVRTICVQSFQIRYYIHSPLSVSFQ